MSVDAGNTVKDSDACVLIQIKRRFSQVLPHSLQYSLSLSIFQQPESSSCTKLDLGLCLHSMHSQGVGINAMRVLRGEAMLTRGTAFCLTLTSCGIHAR